MDPQYFENLHDHGDFSPVFHPEMAPEYVNGKENFFASGEYNNLEESNHTNSELYGPVQLHENHSADTFTDWSSSALRAPNFQTFQTPDPEVVPPKIQKRRDAQRQRYQRMTAEQKKKVRQRKSESTKRCLAKNNAIFETPISQATPEMMVKAQKLLEQKREKAEKERIRYHQATDDERLARNEKKRIARRARKQRERMEIVESQDTNYNQYQNFSAPMGVFGEMDNELFDNWMEQP